MTNYSSYGNVVSGSLSGGSSSAIKLHQGIYIYMVPGAVSGIPGHRWDQSAQLAQLLSWVDEIGAMPNIVGICPTAIWKTLEGNTAGDYTAGFAAVDAILARLALYGKRLMLNFQCAWFGNIGSKADVLPSYIVNGGSYGWTSFYYQGSPTSSFTARVWQAATADRMIALSAAYGARYNSHPLFEMMTIYGETALAVNGNDGYSDNAFLSQVERAYAQARVDWPNTGLKIFVNDFTNNSDANWARLYDMCEANAVCASNPDTWPGDVTASDRYYCGQNLSGTPNQVDRRGKVAWANNVDWQSFNLSGSSPLWPLQTLRNSFSGYTPTNGTPAMLDYKRHYEVWYKNDSNGNSQNNWTGAQKSFLLNAPAATVQPTPTSYTGGAITT